MQRTRGPLSGPKSVARRPPVPDDLTGVEVVRFRASGYDIDLETLEILIESGFCFDISLFHITK